MDDWMSAIQAAAADPLSQPDPDLDEPELQPSGYLEADQWGEADPAPPELMDAPAI